MKLQNSTDFSDRFLRRMISWVCKQGGFGVRSLRRATIRNRASSYSGHAYGSRRIVVSIGRTGFPTKPDSRPGMSNEVLADRIEALVAITSHEIEHLCQYRDGRSRKLHSIGATERFTRVREVECLRAFRSERESLLAQWSAGEHKPSMTRAEKLANIQERRAASVEKSLSKAEAKLKRLSTRIKTLRRRSKYYQAIAAKRAQP